MTLGSGTQLKRTSALWFTAKPGDHGKTRRGGPCISSCMSGRGYIWRTAALRPPEITVRRDRPLGTEAESPPDQRLDSYHQLTVQLDSDSLHGRLTLHWPLESQFVRGITTYGRLGRIFVPRSPQPHESSSRERNFGSSSTPHRRRPSSSRILHASAGKLSPSPCPFTEPPPARSRTSCLIQYRPGLHLNYLPHPSLTGVCPPFLASPSSPTTWRPSAATCSRTRHRLPTAASP